MYRDQAIRDNQLKRDHEPAERGHMSDLFGFIYNLEKIVYGIVFKLVLKQNNIDRALYRVNTGARAAGNDVNIEIKRYIV